VTQVAEQLQLSVADAATPPAVQLFDVSKSIDERPILCNVSFVMPAATFAVVLGANGSGKSTLLRIIATLSAPSSGDIRLFGEIAGTTSIELRRRIGLIGDQPMLYRDLSARENLEFFARLYRVADPVARANEMLGMIGLSHRRNDPVRQFSRGMIQRVAIARALLHDPDLILADEPFAGLDAPSIEALEHLLEQLRDAGKTILLVNHDIDQSLRIADHAVVLRRGRVVVDQPTHRLYEREVLAEVRS